MFGCILTENVAVPNPDITYSASDPSSAVRCRTGFHGWCWVRQPMCISGGVASSTVVHITSNNITLWPLIGSECGNPLILHIKGRVYKFGSQFGVTKCTPAILKQKWHVFFFNYGLVNVLDFQEISASGDEFVWGMKLLKKRLEI